MEYLKVGESKIVDGRALYKPDYYEDIAFGYIFKDQEAYEKDWDAICYIPEHAFTGETPDEDGFYEVCGFSHNDLLDLCYGNRELCDSLFDQCIWAYPETRMQEWDDEDLAFFYRFVKPGAKVWWNDPAKETSGEYTVYGVPFEFDDHGEPIEPETFALDAVIIIGHENSEAEVTPTELTPVYPDLHKILCISQIDGDGVETNISYDEAVEFIGEQAVCEAIQSAKAGCAVSIEVGDDSDINSICFLYSSK